MYTIKQVLKDLRNLDLPRDIDKAFDKIQCLLEHGTRIGWYYQEDLEYFNKWRERNETIRINPPFQGMIISKPDKEVRGELEPDDCIVIVDYYPVEKCYCTYDWVALNRLLDCDDLVEIFELDK